ncbi:hypothetical protein BFJ68_g14448 [Fusarium oxysporum]|uniref:Uncharacterized protein n=2 Tax=Fusarium oxysporum TaxID=5507 RepID=A0A420PUV4_FUSOX|nr:hypothetical protein BFJ65_g16861 [Fusarium oxysporum f. sp. cepae]RKK24232.1 hypothetical protein BFJ66_g17172 [Fusarium oxysporum f. sp. cepae]RKK96262.1 hypothetical protein BFJ68_g14448 [Fusarium oxysporum]
MGKDHLQSVTAAANATATICWFWHKDDCLLSFSGNDTDTGMLLSVDASGGIEIGRVSYFQHGRLYILNLSPESREAKATERRIDRAERSLTSRHLMQQSVLCFSLQVALKIHHRDAQQHIGEAFPPPRSIRQSNTSFRYFVEFNIPSKSQYVVIPETDRPIRHPIYTSAIQYWQYLASLQLQLEMKH